MNTCSIVQHLPPDQPGRVQKHEEWVTDVVINVGDDVEKDEETPEQVVLDMVLDPDQLDLVRHG